MVWQNGYENGVREAQTKIARLNRIIDKMEELGYLDLIVQSCAEGEDLVRQLLEALNDPQRPS
jgi:uncharacterized protein YjgD (DUF1641 family)